MTVGVDLGSSSLGIRSRRCDHCLQLWTRVLLKESWSGFATLLVIGDLEFAAVVGITISFTSWFGFLV